MGAFFGSVHVKSDDRDGVKVVLEKLSGETGIRFLLGPALDGWIGIYPADRGQDSEIGQRLAADLSHPIISASNHSERNSLSTSLAEET